MKAQDQTLSVIIQQDGKPRNEKTMPLKGQDNGR